MRLLQGQFLVKTARTFLKSRFIAPQHRFELGTEWPKWCLEKAGCFVTLQTYPTRELRGCVGFPEPVLPLKDALLEAALSAAFHDTRFPQLGSEELPETVVEVSVLTKPKRIMASRPGALLSSIRLGTDGLILKYRSGSFSGLLLPQVPVEWDWSVSEFVEATCQKAGLPKDVWITDFENCHFFRFQSEIFSEDRPDGEASRK